jgi:hypothetical protein
MQTCIQNTGVCSFSALVNKKKIKEGSWRMVTVLLFGALGLRGLQMVAIAIREG